MEHQLPPAPHVETKAVQTAVLYGPNGDVLKVVEPERQPFGFSKRDDSEQT